MPAMIFLKDLEPDAVKRTAIRQRLREAVAAGRLRHAPYTAWAWRVEDPVLPLVRLIIKQTLSELS
jgi:hypothetical protein